MNLPAHMKAAEYRRLAECFSRWTETCLRAGEAQAAEACRADAWIYTQMAEKAERRAA